MQPRAVIFDLDDTLIIEEAAARSSIRAAAALAPGVDPDEFERTLLQTARRIWRSGPLYPVCHSLGIASWEALWADFSGAHPSLQGVKDWAVTYRRRAWGETIAQLGIVEDGLAEGMSETYATAQRRGHPLVEGADAVVRSLSERLRTGLVTNGPPDIQRLKLEQTGLSGCFRTVLISGEIGVGKPDPEIFKRALDELGVTSSEAVMVGDSWNRDIEGALGARMRAVWVSNGREAPAASPSVPSIASIAKLPEILELGGR